jgi:hypothetical protein
LSYYHNGLKDRDIVATCAEDFENRACRSRRNLECGFISFYRTDRSFRFYGIPFFYLPFAYNAGFHSITLPGHDQ